MTVITSISCTIIQCIKNLFSFESSQILDGITKGNLKNKLSLLYKNHWFSVHFIFGWPWKGPIELVFCAFRHVHHGFFVPIECPLAWWWLSWRGWRRGWCLRRLRPSKLRKLLGEPWQRMIGIEDRFWSLERFHGPIFGMEVFWEGAQLTSGIFWFHEGQQFLVGICVASWLHRWLVQIFLQPWWLIVFVGLCHQLTYVQFAWFLPFFFWVKWSDSENYISLRVGGRVTWTEWRYLIGAFLDRTILWR